MYLRMSPDFMGQDNRKRGAVDKSEALAPTYPQFVMRNSDLRSSFKSETQIVSVFSH